MGKDSDDHGSADVYPKGEPVRSVQDLSKMGLWIVRFRIDEVEMDLSDVVGKESSIIS